jgi:hypothetical protein
MYDIGNWLPTGGYENIQLHTKLFSFLTHSHSEAAVTANIDMEKSTADTTHESWLLLSTKFSRSHLLSVHVGSQNETIKPKAILYCIVSYFTFVCMYGSRDSAVGIATDYGLNG